MRPRLVCASARKTIALIAHDNKKQDLLEWARFNRDTLALHRVVAAGTTGGLLEREFGIRIDKLKSCNRSTADFLISSPLMSQSYELQGLEPGTARVGG
jgi:methylglyoxal synthase